MFVPKVKDIAIELGDRCNFNCAHCGVGRRKNSVLSDSEIGLLKEELRSNKFRKILFVGGETTLYVPEINSIIGSSEGAFGARVSITTNGYFAKNLSNAEKVLGSIAKVDAVQLSYDKFHCGFLPFECVGNLKKACEKLRIGFSVLTAIQDPMDLLLLRKLWKLGNVKVGISKVLPMGSAKDNKVGMKYPSFDPRVLSMKCPGRNSLVYLCGRGFTSCCSLLTRDNDSPELLGRTVRAYLRKPFYRLMLGSTFGQLAKKFGAYLRRPEADWSNPCVFCGHIFASEEGRRWLGGLGLKART